MKRMIIALLLFAGIVCTAMAASNLAENAIEKTCIALRECTRKDENKKIKILKISEAVSTWNRNKKTLYAVMLHDDFSEIEKNMLELENLLQHNELMQIDSLCDKTELLLRNKKEEIQVNFENIF